MAYLTSQEIATYCTDVSGVTIDNVNKASSLIDGYLGGTLEVTTYTDMVKLKNLKRDGYFLYGEGKLKRKPVTVINTVKAKSLTYVGMVDTDFTPASIILEPDESGYFVFYASSMTQMLYGASPKSIVVNYDAGYETIPEDIKQVCAMLAQNIAQRRSFAPIKEISDLDYRVAMSDPSFFTADMRMVLDQYRRL